MHEHTIHVLQLLIMQIAVNIVYYYTVKTSAMYSMVYVVSTSAGLYVPK